MGKAALIFVGVASFIGMFVSLGTRRNLNETQTHVAEHQHEIVARNAALAGLQRAEQNLADEFTGYELIEGTFDGIPYQTTVTLNGGRAVVESVGTSRSGAGEDVEFHVRAEYEPFSQPAGIAESAPPFMEYAVLSNNSLQLNGNIEGDVCEICVDGNDEPTLNANMHTNGNLHVDGNAASVKGFGTYVGNGTANPNKALFNTFQPNYNPSGAESAQRVPAVTIPSFFAEDLANALVPDVIIEGNLELAELPHQHSTRENPYIVYVKGSVTGSGDTNLNGYVMLLVEGNVLFTGNLTAGGDPSYEGGDESSIAIYADGFVDFGGTIEVWGQVFSRGDVQFHGTPTVYGSLTTRSGVDFSGTVNIYYRRASPALTTFWNGSHVQRLRRLAYTEW